jgi:hypothetical protein
MQVVSLARKKWVLLHMQHNVKIAGRAAMKSTFTETSKADTGSIFHARWDLGIDGFLPQNSSFTFASGTRISNHAARSLAGRTRPRNTEKSLLITHLPVAVASSASYRRFALGAAGTAAFFTSVMTPHVDCGVSAENCLFKFQRDVFAQIGAALGPSAGSSAAAKKIVDPEKIAEDFAEILNGGFVTSASSATQPGVSIAIVGGTFIAVGQHGISLATLFELFFGVRVIRIAIRMKLQRELAVGALDLLLAGFADNP